MKKLGKVLLVGALSLGTLVTAEIVQPAKPAQAATVKASDPFNDEWGFRDWSTLYEFGYRMDSQLENQFRTSYKTGDAFNLVYFRGKGPNFGTATDKIKVFRKLDNGQLQRYITINPEWWTDYVYNEQYQQWNTPVTDVYQPGTYVAIAYIDGKHSYSKFFTINK
ncbi:DUF5065 family protein [Bacillus toyonensis]|uniref:DUF5065 family protein n=1 Tax=Bacillus toyonensis TaxID=155322 RepID=UPI000BF22011|nr:DUF5065 family protein [Bacillus toyonensis]PEM44331.1 DUF5065 domain-containing protein [Bacillus toyonensis]